MESLKELHDQHVTKKIKIKIDILLNVKELVKNDLMTCVHYYQHRINFNLKKNLMYFLVKFKIICCY
jgi:hypothetical protein